MLGALMSRLHRPVYNARLENLQRRISPHLKAGDRVLDVGCGSGMLGKALEGAADVIVVGLERAPRQGAVIPVIGYDGRRIPFSDGSFDVVVLADVLHHEEDPERLLAECARVSRRLLVIKDHKADNWFQYLRICLIDWAANAPYGVPCLYRYASGQQWSDLHARMEHRLILQLLSVDLYPPGVDRVFGRRLQYFAVVDIRDAGKRFRASAAVVSKNVV